MGTDHSGYEAPETLEIIGVNNVPEILAGDDLGKIIRGSILKSGETLKENDILVIAQKIISKAEGRMVSLSSVQPSNEALEFSGLVEKDPRLVELILQESVSVVAYRPGVLIVEHKSGLVLANAGIDRSNVAGKADEEMVLLLPENADQTAECIRESLGGDVGIIISDSIGRAWRNGTIGTAIGISGLPGIVNLNGALDMHARSLQATTIGLADEIAAAASIIMGQAAERRPVALVRGFSKLTQIGNAGQIMRSKELDLFR